MKPSRVSRVVQILTTLQAGRSYTAGDLSKIFGTSRRTIFRDLKELQAIGVPYHYDARAGGYTIDPEFFLPPIDLTLQEALSLLLLVHKISSQLQLPFKNSALLAALKIENNLPAKIRQYCNTALQNISTKVGAQAPMKAPSPPLRGPVYPCEGPRLAGTQSKDNTLQNEFPNLLDKTFSQLQKAIVKKHKVNIEYHSLFEGKVIDVELCPYHLLYNQRAWYVLGLSSLHKSVRTFKFNRIKEV